MLAHLKKALYFGVASYCITFVAIEGENDSDESKIYVKLTLPLFALNFLASIFKMKLLLAPAITSGK